MLTKESIEEKTFKKGLFGYNKDEVNSFMKKYRMSLLHYRQNMMQLQQKMNWLRILSERIA